MKRKAKKNKKKSLGELRVKCLGSQRPQINHWSRATPASAAGLPYHIDLSSSPIREDPHFKELAQQVSKDPSLFEKEEELVLSAPFVLMSLEQAETTHFDDHIEKVHQVRKNPHFTEELRDLLEKDLALSSIIALCKKEVLQALRKKSQS